jgi:DNA-binding transcriptional ArsR family regulator
MTKFAPQSKMGKLLAAWPKSRSGAFYLAVSQRTLMELSGISIASVSRHISRLRDEGKVVVIRYLPATAERKHPIAMLRYYPNGTDRADAAWPEASTNMERCRAYRDRMRKSGDWEDTKARRRASHWANKAPARDPLTAALFGVAA